ncbi:MAG: flagellar hook-basal body protein [Defluviitaleaceae bacterium]|nr:flagellar hook-basal body protein [Defluviitaleaceae bacterium]
MMRALWTSASGMTAQQLSVDTIANNIANVNTTGFKRERVDFQSLLYETMQGAGQNPDLVGNRPANLQVGHGVRPIATNRDFSGGTWEPTGSNLDFAINGRGFFTISTGTAATDIAFTRDGSFNLSPTGAGELSLVTNSGLFVLDNAGDPIVLANDIDLQSLEVNQNGQFSVRGEAGETVDLGIQLGLVQFPNRQGLEAIGGNLFLETAASGAPILEAPGDVGVMSQIIQNHLERSNVRIAQEMVELIVSQRAFEVNSRIVTTSNEMLQQTNNMG